MKTLKQYMAGQSKRGNTQKGNQFEQEIAENLRACGWIVDVTELNRSFRRGHWITKKGDFFGQFDIIALKTGDNCALFIQATTDRGIVSVKKRGIDDAIGLPSKGREYLIVTKSKEPGNFFEIYRRMEYGWTPAIHSNNIDIYWPIG